MNIYKYTYYIHKEYKKKIYKCINIYINIKSREDELYKI